MPRRGAHLTAGAEPDDEETAADPEPVVIEELFREHGASIWAVGLGMLHSAQEADDLVQDVFLRAWRALDRLRERKGARAWLMTIAIRVALTRLRRRKMSRFLLQVDEQGAEQTAEPASTPEHRDLVSDVYRVLDELPVELRAAWVLRHIQEETVQGVADLCGWSLSTAKRRLQAAEAVVTARLHARSSSRSR